MTVAAIIQARMGSKRLPKKILTDIAGKPMLWHVVNRLKHSELIDNIIIATSRNSRDDAVEKFCRSNKIKFFRGSEKDVLDRYYRTAGFYKINSIVRITADCPLIDPVVADKVISKFMKSRCDLASNAINRTYPRGLDTEVFSFLSLEKCRKHAKKKYQREHVTPWLYENPKSFKLCSVKNNKDLSHLRWTVDEKADLKFVREIYKRLYRDKKIFLMKDVLGVLKKEPYLSDINKNIKQKKL